MSDRPPQPYVAAFNMLESARKLLHTAWLDCDEGILDFDVIEATFKAIEVEQAAILRRAVE